MTPSQSSNMLVTVSGKDASGITSALTEVLARSDAQILDIAQSVIYGFLTLSILFKISPHKLHDTIADLLHTAQKLGLKLETNPVATSTSTKLHSEKYVLTVLADQISAESLHQVTQFLASTRCNLDTIQRLSEEQFNCVEFTLSFPNGLNRAELKKQLLTVARQSKIDLALQEESLFRRAKRLVVMDMDSTLIQAEVIDELARENGAYDQVSKITLDAMKGAMPFNESLLKRCQHLKGLNHSQLNQVYSRIELTPGAEDLILALKKLGYKVALISGGFDFVADKLKIRLGLDYVFANHLEEKDGVLTGNVIPPLVNAERKAEILESIAKLEKIDMTQTVAIGDGANDLLMLEKAGLGIAFNAKPIVSERADLSFNQHNMRSILYLLGLSGKDITSVLSHST